MTDWFADIWVPGKPVTQGSMSSNSRGKPYTPAKVTNWRKSVHYVIEQFTGTYFGGWEPVSSPVELHAWFYLPQAKSNKDDYPSHSRSGDADKYARAVGDAISLGKHRLITDDSLIVRFRAEKLWAHGMPGADGFEAGTRIKIRKVE